MIVKLRWLAPRICDPPHRVTHPDKLARLVDAFRQRGWDCDHPALVGYERGRRVQLLSGSHRWAAAVVAEIRIPVMVTHARAVAICQGDVGAWKALMQCGDGVFP